MKITGNTVGTTMPRANYNQTDPSKADYIVGRENIPSRDELSSALVVTGDPACVEMVTSNENSATYKSHELGAFVEEIADAYLSGKEVYIYLRTPTDKGSTTIKGTNLPSIRYVDARVDRVFKPVEGETRITAHGIGWSLDGGSMYKVKITASNKFDEYALLDIDLHTPFDATAKPLIVTGKFPASWQSVPEGAASSISNGMDLSHTLDEMCEAFQKGRDVLIRLTNTNSTYEFGNWNLHYAELQVYKAEANIPAAGYYNFEAFGMGCAYNSFGRVETTPVVIHGSMTQYVKFCTPVKA